MNSHFKAAKNAQSAKIANQNEMKFKKMRSNRSLIIIKNLYRLKKLT